MLSRLRERLSGKKEAAPSDEPETLVNAYSTAVALPVISFPHTLHGQRDATDPELAAHLEGFAGFVMRDGAEMTQSRYHLLRHIQRVQQHVSLTIGDSQWQAFGDWAREANAIAFLPDGSIRDPQGRMLLDGTGQGADPQAQTPHPQDAWDRKARSEALLAAVAMRTPASLPPREGLSELRLRRAEDILARARALALVATQASAHAQGHLLGHDALASRWPGAADHLTPAERAFAEDASPSGEDIAQFSWRWECVNVLAHVLGATPRLPGPEEQCHVDFLAQALQAVSEATIRMAPADLLDLHDHHYRLLWVARQASMDGRLGDLPLDAGVVQERCRALNWLVHFQDADWDDVDTPS